MQVLSRVDRISLEAREVELGRALLTLLGFIFYALGFIVGRICLGVYLGVIWVLAAIRLGWRDGHRRGRA